METAKVPCRLAQEVMSPWMFSDAAGWMCAAVGFGSAVLGIVYSAFWVWMLIDCLRREPDRFFWIWLLVIVPFPGALVYAMLRFAPQQQVTAPRWLRRWLNRRELTRLESAAQQIGNAHQYIQWGEALRGVGDWPRAEAAFAEAIRKEPKSLPALWGACQIAVELQRPAEVQQLASEILAIDPQYKFGDVSLAYGRALGQLGNRAALRVHLEQHVRRWRHPEGVYLLACEYADAGERDQAIEQLRALLRDINGSPAAIARKFGRWRSLGLRKLRQLSAVK